MPEELSSQIKVMYLSMKKFIFPALPEKIERILHGGEEISTGIFDFEVIWTPGHSPDHICLYEPDRKILICRDHILPTITPNVGLNPLSGVNPLRDYIDSLKAIGKLEADLYI